jgi:hypothetical protein
MTPYMIHILLPSSDDDIDGETIMEYVYDTLMEAFDTTNDEVEVERDISTNFSLPHKAQQCTVSLIYEGTWSYQIHYNDAPIVLQDSQQWSELHESGSSIEDRKRIAKCYRRLDIVSYPDPHHDYFDDFYAISDYLRNILGQCYTFDPIMNRFRVNKLKNLYIDI